MTKRKFVSYLVKKNSSNGIKKFPEDFIDTDKLNESKMPAKTLVLGGELFGQTELISTDGSVTLHADNFLQAKYIVYANREKPKMIKIPKENSDLNKAVTEYELYLDELMKYIRNEYNNHFPDRSDSSKIVNEVFKSLNLVRY